VSDISILNCPLSFSACLIAVSRFSTAVSGVRPSAAFDLVAKPELLLTFECVVRSIVLISFEFVAKPGDSPMLHGFQ